MQGLFSHSQAHFPRLENHRQVLRRREACSNYILRVHTGCVDNRMQEGYQGS